MCKIQKKEKKKTRKKNKVLILFIVLLLLGAIFVSGYGKENIEHEVRHLKDEVAMYQYNIQEIESKTQQEDKVIVCLDPGHGGKDPGSMHGDRMEKNQNLKMAKRIKKNLERQGIEVILTRSDDSYVSLEDRTRIANNNKADLFVSLHRNYMAGYPNINGIDVYINCMATEKDYAIGNSLYENLSRIDGMKVNALKLGSATDVNENYTVVAETDMTACLIEMGYMSNYMDNIYYDDYFKSYSIAITNSIIKYLDYESSLSADATH